MSQKRRSRGIAATDDGIELLQEAKDNGQNDQGKGLTFPNIAAKADVDEKTVKRFFYGERVDRKSARSICQALSLDLKDVITPKISSVINKTVEGYEESQTSLINTIKVKETEIQRLRQQGSEYKSELAKLEAEKAELEICVKGFDESIGQLKEIGTEFQGRMIHSQQAATWLNEQRQKALAQEAAEYTLREHSKLAQPNQDTDLHRQVKQFSKDIRKCLYLIHHCLHQGRYNLLHKAQMESKLPLSLKPNLYVIALKYIKDQRISEDLPSEVLKELEFYFNYLSTLIEALS